VGRRTGSSDTRQAILEAARLRFKRDGYRTTSLRKIAADAGVDAALISYFFGSKHGLYGETLQMTANPAVLVRQQLELPIDQIPRAIITTVLANWDNPEHRQALVTLIGSASDHEATAALTRGFFQDELAAPIQERLEREGISPSRAELCSGLAVAQIAGLVFTRYVLRLDTAVTAPAQDIIDVYTPALGVVLQCYPRLESPPAAARASPT